MAASYAMRGSREVSPELRERVLAKAEELGYVPSSSARRLRGVEAKRIGIVLPAAGSPSHTRNLQAFDLACRQRGVEVEVHFHYWHEETERQVLTTLLDSGISGLILSPAGEGTVATLMALQKSGLSVPFVTFGMMSGPSDKLDHYHGNYAPDARELGQLCVEHFVNLGHKKLAFLFQGPLHPGKGLPAIARSFQYAVSQQKGVHLELFNLDDSSSPIRQKILGKKPCGLEDLIETDRLLAGYFLDHEYNATVAATSDDLSALALLNECQRRGIKVPEELSIFSLGGSYICQLGSLPLSHASVPINEIAGQVIDRLLENHPEDKNEQFYPLNIVEAGTLANRIGGRPAPRHFSRLLSKREFNVKHRIQI